MSAPLFLLCNSSSAAGTTASPEVGDHGRRHACRRSCPLALIFHPRAPRPRLSHAPPQLTHARFSPLHGSRLRHPPPPAGSSASLRQGERKGPFCCPQVGAVAGGGGGGVAEPADHGDGPGDGSNSGGKGDGNSGRGDRGWYGPFNYDGWMARLLWWGGEVKKEAFCSRNGALASFLPLLCLSWFGLSQLSPAALARSYGGGSYSSVWEIRGGKWTMLVPDPSGEDFVMVTGGGKEGDDRIEELFLRCWRQVKEAFVRLMLPEGYPASVTSDYLEYSLWRGVQGIASQVSGVLSTQALLYAVGLGKGAIPTAAAINWVLKDGLGYLSKIMLSKYGRHFDVSPKGWRLFADLLENAAYGMEILTPAFPHLFVLIGAAAGAGRSAAALIQAATRSCFYAGFAAERNFAEVIAKGEAQGMVSKFLGITLGISLANAIGSSTPLALAAFGAVTAVHMYCNLKSYQSIQLRTLNPYRASLVFSEYLLSGQVPGIKEVNDEEPLFTDIPIDIKPASNGQPKVLSAEAKDAALQIVRRLQLGARLSELVGRREEALALFDLFRDQPYLLLEARGQFYVVLKEDSTPEDMLKSLFHVSYLYWLERNLGSEPRGVAEDCGRGGRLRMSLDYVQREFGHAQLDGWRLGWTTDGLIARPLPNRIRLGGVEPSPVGGS